MKTKPPMQILVLEQEARALRALVAQFHYHVKVFRLLSEDNLVEQTAWMLRGERLLLEAEEMLPALK